MQGEPSADCSGTTVSTAETSMGGTMFGRMPAGQSSVQFAYARLANGFLTCALKFFAKQSDFEEEANTYKTCAPELRRFMPRVLEYQANTHGLICDPFGNTLPPYIVMEKGESLREIGQRMRVDVFTAAQVCRVALVAPVHSFTSFRGCLMIIFIGFRQACSILSSQSPEI